MLWFWLLFIQNSFVLFLALFNLFFVGFAIYGLVSRFIFLLDLRLFFFSLFFFLVLFLSFSFFFLQICYNFFFQAFILVLCLNMQLASPIETWSSSCQHFFFNCHCYSFSHLYQYFLSKSFFLYFDIWVLYCHNFDKYCDNIMGI